MTFRTTEEGTRVDPHGQVLNNNFVPVSIFHHETTITGAQLQVGSGTPITIIPAPSDTQALVPIAWSVSYAHSTTDFTGNVSLELIDHQSNVLGEATNAISGSASKLTTGTIASASTAFGGTLKCRVKTGNPTAGSTSASAKVRVAYLLLT